MITAFINKPQSGKHVKVISDGYAGTNAYTDLSSGFASRYACYQKKLI